MLNWIFNPRSGKKIIHFFLFFSFSLFLFQPVFSQRKTRPKEPRKKFHPIEIRTLNDTLIPTLVNKVASYTFTIDRDNFLLGRNFDLLLIEENLPAIEDRIKGFRSIFERVGQNMNLQGLSTSVIIVKDLTDKLTAYKVTLDAYKNSLKESNNKIKRIIADSALKAVVSDSALTIEMEDLLTEGHDLDSSQTLLKAKVNLLYSRISVNQFEANDIISDMMYMTIAKKAGLFTPEDDPLFQSNPGQYHQSTRAIVLQELRVSGKVTSIYLSDRIHLLLLVFVLFVLIFTWFKLNIRRIGQRENAAEIMSNAPLLNRKLIIGCLLGFFTIAPLIFANPPSALLHSFELLRLVLLSILIFSFLTRPFKKVWIVFVLLWIYFALDDLLLQASYGERWYLFTACVLLVLICLMAIFKSRKIFTGIEYSPVTRVLLLFTLLLALLSIAYNLAGNFSLAKIVGVTAIQCLMLGITLKILCTIVVEAMYLQSEAYHETRLSDFLNFEKMKFGLRRILWILASLVWIVGFARDLTLYGWLSNIFIHFLETKRPIGKYDFTFSSVFIFIAIIWFASIISRIINYFFGYEKSVATGRRSSINSMILILRLCIWAVGFLIAVAAAGIPLDKISIMIGALGVGIGFGLQTIVNNLVSGVILAFERPMQVGDQIEIGDKSGTVKEIGVRASKINNSKGADIIIPNGDMLSQHLINWTLQNRNKQIGFAMGVAYDTNLEKVRSLILDKLKTRDDILQSPEPSFIVQDFGQYMVELKVLFWIPDLFNASAIRTNVMIEAKELLAKEGISMQTRIFNPRE